MRECCTRVSKEAADVLEVLMTSQSIDLLQLQHTVIT